MARAHIQFDWNIGEAAMLDAIVARAATAERTGAGEAALVRWLARASALVLVAMVAAAATALSPYARAQEEARAGIGVMLAWEQQIRQAGDRDALDTLLEPEIASRWAGQWRMAWQQDVKDGAGDSLSLLDVAPLDDFVRADVSIAQPVSEWWQLAAYREPRYYRQAGSRWLRTLPPDDYWGAQASLSTEHVRFMFYEPDAPHVAAVAEILEDGLVELRATLGLRRLPGAPALTIDVQPSWTTGWNWRTHRLHILSPQLAQMPADQSDAEFLAHQIFDHISYMALHQATESRAGRTTYHWTPLIGGLHIWLQRNLLAVSYPWYDQAAPLFADQLADRYPLSLEILLQPPVTTRALGREETIWLYLAAESMIDYVVDTYGRDQLPVLARSLTEAADEHALAAIVFGLPAEELEAGWNRYLAETRGLD